MFKKFIVLVLALMMLAAYPTSFAFAATPDGLGPWADSVVTTTQGLRKDGSPVLAPRSDPSSALGVAEHDVTWGNFYSLGFGGTMTLGFENGISSGSFVVEASTNPYFIEKAKVEVSEDGVNFYPAGTVSQDGSVALPSEVTCGKFVRLTDVTDKTPFEPEADGYDVDGVKAEGLSCSTTGKMTGGGKLTTSDGTRVTHGFKLRCNMHDVPQTLEINWDKGNKFHLKQLTSVSCTEDPAIDQGHPKATFDTYTGSGSGKMNGVSGYTAEWVFTDAGEPGKNDTAKIIIKDPSNVVVLSTEGSLKKGNHQAHK